MLDDPEVAKAEVEDAFVSICEREYPKMRETGSQVTACHLYEKEERDAVAAPSPSD